LRFTIRIWLVRACPSSAVYFPLPEMQTVTISHVLFQFRSDPETVSGSDRFEHESKRCDSFGIFSNSIRGLKLRSELVIGSVQVRGYSVVTKADRLSMQKSSFFFRSRESFEARKNGNRRGTFRDDLNTLNEAEYTETETLRSTLFEA